MQKEKPNNNNNKPQRHLELLKPYRELAESWNIDISDHLISYCEEIEGNTNAHAAIDLNFSQAAILVQNSAQVYTKKVESLYDFVFRALERFSLVREQNDTLSTAVVKTTTTTTAKRKSIDSSSGAPSDSSYLFSPLFDDGDVGSQSSSCPYTVKRNGSANKPLGLLPLRHFSHYLPLGQGGVDEERNLSCLLPVDAVTGLLGMKLESPQSVFPSSLPMLMVDDVAQPLDVVHCDSVHELDNNDDGHNDGPNGDAYSECALDHQSEKEDEEENDEDVFLDPHSVSSFLVDRPFQRGQTFLEPPPTHNPPRLLPLAQPVETENDSDSLLNWLGAVEKKKTFDPVMLHFPHLLFLKTTMQHTRLSLPVLHEEHVTPIKASSLLTPQGEKHNENDVEESQPHQQQQYEEYYGNDDYDHHGDDDDYGDDDGDGGVRADFDHTNSSSSMTFSHHQNEMEETDESNGQVTVIRAIPESYAQVVRQHVSLFIERCRTWTKQESSPLCLRVNSWHDHLEPILTTESLRPSFNLKACQDTVMNRVMHRKQVFKTDTTTSFDELVRRCHHHSQEEAAEEEEEEKVEKWQVCRWFLTTLVLANAGEVAILAENGFVSEKQFQNENGGGFSVFSPSSTLRAPKKSRFTMEEEEETDENTVVHF